MSSIFSLHETFKLTWIIVSFCVRFNSFSKSLRCVFVTGFTKSDNLSRSLLIRNARPFHHLKSLARFVALHPLDAVSAGLHDVGQYLEHSGGISFGISFARYCQNHSSQFLRPIQRCNRWTSSLFFLRIYYFCTGQTCTN